MTLISTPQRQQVGEFVFKRLAEPLAKKCG
jgi:hypothetical protein